MTLNELKKAFNLKPLDPRGYISNGKIEVIRNIENPHPEDGDLHFDFVLAGDTDDLGKYCIVAKKKEEDNKYLQLLHFNAKQNEYSTKEHALRFFLTEGDDDRISIRLKDFPELSLTNFGGNLVLAKWRHDGSTWEVLGVDVTKYLGSKTLTNARDGVKVNWVIEKAPDSKREVVLKLPDDQTSHRNQDSRYRYLRGLGPSPDHPYHTNPYENQYGKPNNALRFIICEDQRTNYTGTILLKTASGIGGYYTHLRGNYFLVPFSQLGGTDGGFSNWDIE